ncbi:glycosyltransferase family 4 protein [Paenibacillus kribbensis]|uniref:glycosyltransferase family 4 protein n=1 Tax=Paenibacillus kribbensis TaxID=172713 RepID=UPI002DBB6058|nr:glycosyltransferase family 4 protein [Paenibacillus kribbensis]MEC0237697.1 glycosyltransferase family 4 protein [Paenibacillus kribbensis]
MENLKILFTYIVPSGGMETLNRTRGEVLQKYGVNCHFLYSRDGAGLQNGSSCPTHISDDDQEIQQLLKKEGFEAVVVSSDFIMLERLRRLGFTGPIIFEVQGLGPMEYATQFINNAALYILSYADALLYPPTSHLNQLFAQFPTKIHFNFSNCVDTAKIQYRPNIKHSYPIIGWVGRIESNKNWRECLEIVHHSVDQEPNLRLWLFEDPNLCTRSEREDFLKMVSDFNLEHRLVLFSNIPHSEMPYYYSAIGDSGGYLLSTSILEGFGYAVAEAMSCRCPILSTDSDGVRAFIKHDITGKFYPTGSIEAAVQQGLELMRNYPLRNSIRKKGREHIESTFGLETYVSHFIGMLHYLGL